MTAEARIVGERNSLWIDSAIVRAERRHGAGEIAPGASAMMHPVHVLRLAHILMTCEAAPLSTAAIARLLTASRAQMRARPCARSGSAAKGHRPVPPAPVGVRHAARSGWGHGCRSHFPQDSVGSEPVRASLGGRMPEGGKSGTLNRQHNLLREMGGPWQGSARQRAAPIFSADATLCFRHNASATVRGRSCRRT